MGKGIIGGGSAAFIGIGRGGGAITSPLTAGESPKGPSLRT